MFEVQIVQDLNQHQIYGNKHIMKHYSIIPKPKYIVLFHFISKNTLKTYQYFSKAVTCKGFT